MPWAHLLLWHRQTAGCKSLLPAAFCHFCIYFLSSPSCASPVALPKCRTKFIVAVWTLDIPIRFRTAYRDPVTGFMVRKMWPEEVAVEKRAATQTSAQTRRLAVAL